MTQITVKQLAAAKRTAMNVLPLTNKKAKLYAKIAEMEKEIDSLNEQIDAQQGYVKSFAGGLTTEQLLVRNENKAFEANSAVLQWDDTNRVWVVIESKDEDPMPQAYANDKAQAEEEIADARPSDTAYNGFNPDPVEVEEDVQTVEEESLGDPDPNDPFAA